MPGSLELTFRALARTVMTTMAEPITVLFLSSAVKGQRCIQEFKRQGCKTYLLTEERYRGDDWPYDALDGVHYMHSLSNRQHVINTVAWMSRGMHIDILMPLDEYEIETAAVLREYFQLPGLGVSQAHVYNDKLAMRMRARAAEIPVPAFSSVFNYEQLRVFMDQTPGPWLLKPRNEAGAMGIKRCESADQVWRWLEELGDNQSNYLLEKFVPSDVFHVDSVIVNGQVKFCLASGYGRPPLAVSHGGGVFTSRTLAADSQDGKVLHALNQRVIETLGMREGVSHIEFLRPQATREWLFLEAAARVGGANLSDMIEQATGLNPWVEWARVELARVRAEAYAVPVPRANHAGILVCLSHQQSPDLASYDAPEVAWRMHKPYHAGLIVVSPDSARVENLLDAYAQRFAADFLTRATPMETGRQN
jgi:hypothetical protein